jgi:hypothetical protein
MSTPGAGRKRPKETNPSSAAYLLDSFANAVYLKQMQYHSRAVELARLVTEVYVSPGGAPRVGGCSRARGAADREGHVGRRLYSQRKW